jgi:formate dehydrogenase major subunit
VQRTRKAVEPPAGARDDMDIVCELARRLGHDWGHPSAEDVWNELRQLSPMHAGMSYARLEASGGIQWPCYDESHPGELFLHSRLWQEPLVGPRAQFSVIEFDPPVDALDEKYPIRLTTGRRLDSYNTGVQTAGYQSPLWRREALQIAPEDGVKYGVADGERVRISSRRGSVDACVRYDTSLRPGLAFLSYNRPEEVPTNFLTIDAVDSKSGTAEYKAAAIRIDRLSIDD